MGSLYKLREAIRFKVEQRMEGARKDRHMTQNTMPHLVCLLYTSDAADE